MARHAAYILGPLAFLGAALILIFALLPACAVVTSLTGVVPARCEPPPPDPETQRLDREVARGKLLEAEIRRLERQLLAKANCPVAPPPPPPPPPAPPPAPEPPPEETEDRFDRERWDEGDISLMEGCWLLDSDYSVVFRRTGLRLTVPYWRACFDAEGNGTQTVRLSDGAECSVPLSAEFIEGEGMRFQDQRTVPCSGGKSLYRRTANCTLDDQDRAVCVMDDDGGGSANIRLRRDR
ncbi:MAG: hypothetical protein AAF334_07190 [Pseudomonadota bacterium]